MPTLVLDASVLMAIIQLEPGHERLLNLDDSVLVSSVNMAEARSRLSDKGLKANEIENSLSLISKTIVDFTDEDARAVGNLREPTRKAGLSLGDRACLALAMANNAVALTADRVWAKANLPVKIEYIR
jgi:ribonuclease VapC